MHFWHEEEEGANRVAWLEKLTFFYPLKFDIFFLFPLQADVVIPHDSEAAPVLTATWPECGHLQFVEVRLRYQPSAPYALAGLSLEVQSGQKIGICGRTGDGDQRLYRPSDL